MFRIVRIFDGDGTRTRPDRATPMQIAHIFRTRYSGGRGKPSPLRGKIQMPRSMSTQPDELKEFPVTASAD
jgi:hypothetical protein